jgi:hypothetical protein
MKFTVQIFICFLLFVCAAVKTRAQTNISGIINNYYKATAIVSGTISGSSYSGITLQSIAGLAKGDRVLIIQMKGAAIDETNSSSFGNITGIGNAGKYEFSSICGFLNNTIVLSNQLLNTYDVSLIQVVRVPVYDDAVVVATLQAQAWDAVTGLGGILALEVTGTLTLNANINASGAGFKGGQLFVNTTNRSCPTPNYFYSVAQSTAPSLGAAPKGEGIAQFITLKEHGVGKQANGGGGANIDNNGGGGGSNYGTGGVGGRKPLPASCSFLGIPAAPNAQGGLALNNTWGYSVANNKIFLGGGGGCGEMNNYENPPTNTIPSGTPGGNGGGIVYIKCNQLNGNGFSISSNGSQGINAGLSPVNASKGDGGGGGGGGGIVLLNCNNYSGTLTVEARGGNGCNSGIAAQCGLGPGGGGGGGVIWHAGTLSATTNVTGGTNGVVTSCSNTANGATAGGAGIVQTGFVAPQGTVPFVCAVLPVAVSLKEWWGKKVTSGIQLKWKLEQTATIDEVWLEKKTIRGPFKTTKVYEQPAEGFYEYTDDANDLPATYRLLVISLDGKKEYSSQLFFEHEKVKRLLVYPNPVKNELRVELPVTSFGRGIISIFDYTGKLVVNKEVMFNTNQRIATVETAQLPAGTYTVKCFWKDELYVAKIIKQ